MNCHVATIFGLGMLFASYNTMSVSEEQRVFLRGKLSSNLEDIYSNIIIERRNHYIQGLILGLIIGYFSLKYMVGSSTFHKMMIVISIALLTSVVYYFLMPKSDYMINHLKTTEENIAWLEVYKRMKQRYFLGFIFGSFAAIPIAYGMC